jgi:predicted cupin superfamily sugar epimerase
MILKRGNDFSNFLWNMEIKNAVYWIKHLQLSPHPEGGYYKETFRSNEQIEKNSLPRRFMGPRSFSTAIYFLLRSSDRSVFHRIKSDELWHFYAGSVIEIFVLHDGKLQVFKLGSNLEQNESLQIVIPAESWFAAKVSQPDTYTLAGCTVAPGFEFEDFEIANRDELVNQFPNEKGIIFALT